MLLVQQEVPVQKFITTGSGINGTGHDNKVIDEMAIVEEAENFAMNPTISTQHKTICRRKRINSNSSPYT